MKLSIRALFTLTLICASLHIAHASPNLPLREKIIAIDPHTSSHNKESSSTATGVSQVVTKHTTVYPAYGYITTYTWQPCTDEDDHVVFSGGFKLQQTNDSNAAKFYINNSNSYYSNGWTWKVTNTNTANLAMDLYVQCGEQPFEYSRKSLTHGDVAAGASEFYVSCPTIDNYNIRGMSTGFSVPTSTGFIDNAGYYSGGGALSWLAAQSGQTVGQSVVCGFAWGFTLFGDDWVQSGDWVTYSEGAAVKVPAGSKSTTATASCYRYSTYYTPLAAGFYSTAVSVAPGLRLIANYVSGAYAYITVANSGTRDVWVTPSATCDGEELPD